MELERIGPKSLKIEAKRMLNYLKGPEEATYHRQPIEITVISANLERNGILSMQLTKKKRPAKWPMRKYLANKAKSMSEGGYVLYGKDAERMQKAIDNVERGSIDFSEQVETMKKILNKSDKEKLEVPDDEEINDAANLMDTGSYPYTSKEAMCNRIGFIIGARWMRDAIEEGREMRTYTMIDLEEE